MRAVVKTTLNIILMKSNMMMVMAVMVLADRGKVDNHESKTEICDFLTNDSK